MKHRRGFNPLERSQAHRKALHRNMVTSLFRYERIRTTLAKAREIRRSAERLITRAKIDSLHNRRIVSSRLYDLRIKGSEGARKDRLVAKLFTDIALRMKERPGGYTRIVKLGKRPGDASEMVILELIDFKLDTSGDADKKAKKEEKKDKKPSAKAKKEDAKKDAPAKKEKGGVKGSEEHV
jgi:large subunit ribosomal protein L17